MNTNNYYQEMTMPLLYGGLRSYLYDSLKAEVLASAEFKKTLKQDIWRHYLYISETQKAYKLQEWSWNMCFKYPQLPIFKLLYFKYNRHIKMDYRTEYDINALVHNLIEQFIDRKFTLIAEKVYRQGYYDLPDNRRIYF